MKMQVTFRSGVQIEADVEEFTLGRGGIDGALREITWTNKPVPARRLKYLDASEIVAVVAVHDPSEQPGPAETL